MMVGPIKRNDLDGQAAFHAFFSSANTRVIDVNGAVAMSAARMRVSHGLKLADAVHLATALAAGCSRFATTDLVFDKPSIRSLIQIDLLPP